jgi:DNA-binding protein HU-beta
VNKNDVVEQILERREADGWSKRECQQALDTVLEVISDGIASGERVTLAGFGTFDKRERAARSARNPQTGETVRVKKTSVPGFKASTTLKRYVASSKRDQAAFRKARG